MIDFPNVHLIDIKSLLMYNTLTLGKNRYEKLEKNKVVV